MTATPADKDILRAQYEQVRPKYQWLEDSLRRDLLASLHDARVSVLTIESRLKDSEPLCAKAGRKGYANPPDEVRDLCGIRMICHYTTDVTRVRQLAKLPTAVAEQRTLAYTVSLKEDTHERAAFPFLWRT